MIHLVEARAVCVERGRRTRRMRVLSSFARSLPRSSLLPMTHSLFQRHLGRFRAAWAVDSSILFFHFASAAFVSGLLPFALRFAASTFLQEIADAPARLAVFSPSKSVRENWPLRGVLPTMRATDKIVFQTGLIFQETRVCAPARETTKLFSPASFSTIPARAIPNKRRLRSTNAASCTAGCGTMLPKKKKKKVEGESCPSSKRAVEQALPTFPEILQNCYSKRYYYHAFHEDHPDQDQRPDQTPYQKMTHQPI